MATKKSAGTNRSRSPTVREIRDALKISGYPLEIRLLETFHRAGMDPVNNPRQRVDDVTPTREIDLLAHFTEFTDGIRVTLRALIEAKGMASSNRFVGFTWKAPSEHELRAIRMKIGGLPNFLAGCGPTWDRLFADGGPAQALDPLNEPPVCVQWSTVMRAKGHDGDLKADHEPAYWNGIDTIVRSVAWRAREVSSHPEGSPSNPILLFEYPTLVIATPTLLLFDATTGKITRSDSLTLLRQFEVADGEVQFRIVDVVTEKGIAGLISRYRRTINGLISAFKGARSWLVQAAEEQRMSLAQSELEETRDGAGLGIFESGSKHG